MNYRARCHCGQVACEFGGDPISEALGMDLHAIKFQHFTGRAKQRRRRLGRP